MITLFMCCCRKFICYGERMTRSLRNKLLKTSKGQSQVPSLVHHHIRCICQLSYIWNYFYTCWFVVICRQLGEQANLEFIKDAGHLVHSDQAPEYNQRLKNILASVNKWDFFLILMSRFMSKMYTRYMVLLFTGSVW